MENLGLVKSIRDCFVFFHETDKKCKKVTITPNKGLI